MRKLYNSIKFITCLALLFVAGGNVFGQGLEDFTNSNATSTYASSSFVGNDAITWTYVASRDGNGDANSSEISLPALMLRRVSDASSITSSTISGGIGDFSIKLYKGFTGAGDRQVEIFINDVSQGVSTAFDDLAEHIFEVNGINVDGDIVIKITNPNSGQIIIDDITWTGFVATPDTDAPIFQNSTPAASSISDTGFQLDVELDEAGTAYYVVLADGATAPTAAQVIAGTDATDAVATNGSIAVASASPNSFNDAITGLSATTAYDIYVVAQDDEGTPNVQATATLLEVTTTTAASEVSTVTNAAGEPANISSLENDATLTTTTDGVKVWDFNVFDGNGTDDDSDTKPTIYTGFTIRSAASNVPSWTAAIQSAALFHGTTKLGDGTISADNIDFSGITAVTVGDGAAGSETISLYISLNTTVTDQDVLQFSLASADITTEGTGTSSQLAAFATIESDDAKNIIEVEATAFDIDVKSNVEISKDFSLTATAVDANGNTDVVARNITVSRNAGTGNLTSVTGLGALSMTNGVYTWSDLQFDTEESISIDVADGVSITTTSTSIEVVDPIRTVFFSEYIEGSGNNKVLEIYNNSGSTINLADFSIELYPNGASTADKILPLSDVTASLADKNLIIVANSGGAAEFTTPADLTMAFGDANAVTNFTGDDAVALLYKGIIIDLIGEIGVRPSTGWDVAGTATATANKTLVRKSEILEGNSISTASFGTNTSDSEWIVLPQNDVSSLGTHYACTPPATQATSVTFGTTDDTSMIVNWTQGDGDKALVVVKSGAAVDIDPVSGTDYTTATSVFSDAVIDLGSSNIVVFTGNSADQTVTVTGLSEGTTYHVSVYEYNSVDFCYNTTSPASGNNTTTTPVTVTITEALVDFGSVDNGSTSTSQSFTVEGTNLSGDITVTAPAYFEVSLDDATFSSTVNFTPTTGTVTASTVYVRFAPTSGLNGVIADNLVVSTTGATDQNVAVSGTESGNPDILHTEDFSTCPSASWMTFSVASDKNWACTVDGNTDNAMEANGFGGDVASDDWLISPAIDLSTATNATLTFNSFTRFADTSYPKVDAKVSTDYAGSGDPSSATWTSLSAVYSPENSQVWTASGDIDLDTYVGSSIYIAFQYTTTGTGNGTTSQWRIDDILIEDRVAANPVLDVTASLVDFGSADININSTSQSFTISGTDLKSNVTVTAPNHFEVSTDDATFSNSVNLVHTGGSLTETTVYVRFSPTSGLNGTKSGNITISSTDAISVTLPVSGTETGNATAYTQDFNSCLDLNFWSEYSVIGDQLWQCTTFGNNSTDGVQISGFSGSALDNEDWLISPALEIDAASSLSFWSRTKFAGLSIEVKVSSDYTGTGDPSTAIWTDLAPTLPAIDSDVWTETAGLDLSAFAGSSRYIAFIYYSNPTDGAPRWTLDDVVVTNSTLSVTPPSLTVAGTLTDFGSIDNGSSSTSQNFTVEGADLTADITVTAPSNFEVSLDNTTFSAEVTLTPTGGVVATTTVHVRFAPSSGGNGVKSGNITIATSGTANETVAVTGTEAGNTTSSFIEDFTNSNATTTYTDNSFVGNNGITWTYVASRDGNGDANASGIDLPALMLRRVSDNSKITSSTISDGIKDFSVKLYKGFTGTNDRQVELLINGVSQGTSVPFDNFDEQIFAVNSIDIAGDFTIEIVNLTAGQVIIDDISWTSFNSNSPFITIDNTNFNGAFGALETGMTSASSSFTVTGNNLEGVITVTAPAGFTVSTDNVTFTASVDLPQASADELVYVKFEPTAVQVYSANITLSSINASEKTLAVTGTGISADAIFFEDFSGCVIGDYNTISVIGDQVWSCNANGRTGEAARMNGYSGGAQDNEDWLITDAVDLSSATNATLTFYTDVAFPTGDGLEILASSDYSGSGDPTSSTWTTLSANLDTESANGTWVASGDIDLATFVGGNVYVAFKYTSTTAGASQWTIDDISIEDRVAVEGPGLTVTESITDFGSVDNGATSTSQSFTVEGANLTTDITVTAPTNFEVSLDNATFSADVVVPQTGGVVATTTVHVRFAPASGLNGVKSGNLTISTTGTSSQTIAISGTESGNSVTVIPISDIRPVNANGEPTTLNDVVTIEGTLIGPNSRTTGFQIAINDGTGGVILRETSGAFSAVTEGDEIRVTGIVGFFNGATQIGGITAVEILSSGNTRVEPTVVTVLNETTEQELVKLENVTIVDNAEWLGDPAYTGSGFNVNITFGDGSSTGVLRIEDDGNLHLKTFETVFGTQTSGITLIGIGGQFDNTSPYNEGYQLLVYQESDINPVDIAAGFTISTTDFNGAFGSIAVGETSAASSYTVAGAEITGDLVITVASGFEVSLTSDFTNFVGTSSIPLSITPENGLIDNVTVYARFAPDAIGAFSGNIVHSATGYDVQNITVTGEGTAAVTGLDDLLKYNISVYPNPVYETLTINIPETFGAGDIKLINLNGSVVSKGTIGNLKTISVSNLTSGIYLLQITNNKTVINYRVVVK